MKNLRVVRIRNLIIGAGIIELVWVLGCGGSNQITITSNQIANSNNSGRGSSRDVPKSSPTIEIAVKDKLNKTVPPVQNPDKSSVTKKQVNPEEQITRENFDKINNGMTYGEVTKILRDKGMKTSEMKVNGRESVLYKWTNDDFSKYIDVEFSNDEVTNKRQKGL